MVNQSWPAVSPGVVDREDVGVLEPGGELDLALEALGAERGGQLGMEDLERDRPVVLQVVGEIDRGHAPAPELALERVAVPKACASVVGRSATVALVNLEGICAWCTLGAIAPG